MDGTNNALGDAISRWAEWPSPKQRTAVQHAVCRLLDDLAPERAPPRAGAPQTGVQRHRSPRGCILQGAAGAVTVSWFPAAGTEAQFGELQIRAWRGVVTRPGSARRAGDAAVVVQELALHPVQVSPDVWGWLAADDTAYDDLTLAARCRALLDHEAPDRGAAPRAD